MDDEHEKDQHSLSERADSGHPYAHIFDPTDNARNLQKSEESAGNFTSPDPSKSSDIQNQESNQPLNTAAPWNNNTSSQSTGGRRGFMSRAKSFMMDKKKGPATAIATLVVGAVISGGVFFGGSLGPLFFINNITLDLNDQLSALNIASNVLFKHKMTPFSNSQTTTLGCTKVGAALSKKCAFATLSKNHRERLERVGFVIEGDDLFAGRTKPTRISLDGVDFSPTELTEAFRTDRKVFNAIATADHMSFIGLRSKTIVERVLPKLGRTGFTAPNLTGDYDERIEKFGQLYSGEGANRTPNFIEATDGDTRLQKDGEPAFYLDGTGDVDGNDNRILYTQAEVDAAIASYNDALTKTSALNKTPTHFSPGEINVLRGLNLLGVADQACDLRNMVGSAAVAAKVSNSVQLARLFLDAAAFVGKLHANTATPEDAEFIQRLFNDTDARKTLDGWTEQADGSFTIKEEGENPVPNPTYGMSALDSELYKMSANGGVAATSTVDQNYSLGFGTTSTLRNAGNFLNAFDTATGEDIFGSSACGFVQNKWVRGAGYIAGTLVTGFTFGGFTVLNTSVQVALFVGTYAVGWALNSALQDNLITETLLTTASVERGSAIWTGMSVVLGQTAMSRGMMPGNADEIVAYQLEQDTARQSYIALERQKADPFDLKNPYSASATMAYSMASHMPNDLSSVTSLSSSVASLVSDGFSSVLSPYTARAASLDPARFQQCDDESYSATGIDADVQCNVRYVMPSASLDVNPLEVAQWMENEGYVEMDTTTGFPKGYTPPDGGKQQSIAKSLIMGVVDTYYDTRDYGVRVDPETGAELGRNDYGIYLDFCVYRSLPFGETYEEFGQLNGVDHDWRTGKNCRKTDSHAINMFRAYTFYLSANDDLDEGPIESTLDCGPVEASVNSANNQGDVAKIDAAIKASQENNPNNPHPLDGKGSMIVQLSDQYGVNARFIATTLLAETQFGADGAIGPRYNNFGYNKLNDANECEAFTFNGDQYNCYDTPEKGIEGILKNLTTNSRYKEEAGPNGAAAGTVAAVRNIYCPEGDGDCNINNFLKMSEAIDLPITGTDPVFISSSSSGSSSSVATSVPKVSQTQITQQITSYGLPAPTADGETGYNALLTKLKDDPNAAWAAQAMLNGEKSFKSKGGEIQEYLTTAWVWFETGGIGADYWPDPYEVNCMSNTNHPTSETCNIGAGNDKVQVAGYQAWDVRHRYREIFTTLYSESDLEAVLQKVIENGSKASKDVWKYDSADVEKIKGVTMDDIYADSGVNLGEFNDDRKQFVSFVLGKDPAMAAALNSFAVSEGDVVTMLRDCKTLGWSNNDYYCDPKLRPLISNMMMALYMFDGNGPAGSGICADAGRGATGSGVGISAVWGGGPEVTMEDLSYGFKSVPDPGSGAQPDWYDYAIKFGLNGSEHTGTDIPMAAYAPVYSPVEGVVMCERNGVGEGVGEIGCDGAGDLSGTGGKCSTNGYDANKPKGAGTILIKVTKNGTPTGDYLRLGHLSDSLVEVGDTVKPNQEVGAVGCMNGWHVHVEYFITAQPGETSSGYKLVDPVVHLDGGTSV